MKSFAIALLVVALAAFGAWGQSISGTGFKAPVTLTSGTGPHGAVTSDFDNDGDQDLAVISATSNDVYVYVNDGTGAFGTPAIYSTGGSEPIWIDAGDLNGDSHADLAISHGAGNKVTVLFNDGTGLFGPAQVVSTGSHSHCVMISDLDGDGDRDMAITYRDSYPNLLVLLNNGSGSFAVGSSYNIPYGAWQICPRDYDGDGDLDLAVTSGFFSSTITILKNTGTGTFDNRVDYTVLGGPNSMAAGDIDNDGDNDLVVGCADGNSIHVLVNSGTGAFVDQAQYAAVYPISMALSDLNGDGWLDMVACEVSTDSLVVYINGNGSFGWKMRLASGSGPRYVVASDLTGDTRPDLVCANYVGGTTSIFENASTRRDYCASTGHWYQVVKGPNAGSPWISWTAARDSAFALGGYLACLSSTEENAFVTSIVPANYTSKAIGGYEITEGNWAWVSGEPFAFTNWAPGEPNNGWGGTEAYMYLGLNFPGQWHDGTLFGADAFVVEYDPNPNLVVILPDTILPCASSSFVVPVSIRANQPLSGINIPLKIPAGITITAESIVPAGWNDYSVVRKDLGYVQLMAVAGAAAQLPVGTTTVFNLTLTAPSQCKADWIFEFDTTFSSDPARSLQAANTAIPTRSVLLDFDRLGNAISIKGYLPGDFNLNGTLNLADISAIVSYLTGGGATLCLEAAGDMNRDGKVNLADLSMLVTYLTTNDGMVLKCAYSKPAARVNGLGANLAIKTSHEDGVTTIAVSTPLDLNAVQLTVQGVALTPENSLAGSFDLLQGEKDGQTNIILIDMKGRNTIGLGTTQLIRIPGQVEVVKAEASDLAFESYDLAINPASKPTDLPTEFSLAQNYPNPFNPTTRIDLDLPKPCEVKLEVYNLLGQKVRTLIDGQLSAGSHTYEWNSTDDNGRSVSSGIYLYRLNAGDYLETKKMVLLK